MGAGGCPRPFLGPQAPSAEKTAKQKTHRINRVLRFMFALPFVSTSSIAWRFGASSFASRKRATVKSSCSLNVQHDNSFALLLGGWKRSSVTFFGG